MRVVLAARRQDRLEELEHALLREGLQALSIRVDLRRELDILTLFERIRRHWGGVDVLVNNAGLGHLAPLMSGETESWREMWEINVLGLSICSREVVRDLQQRGGEGHIIHISSMSGHRVPPGSGMYAATKHAVRALTEGLRMELHEAGSPARVSAISPGFVETELQSATTEIRGRQQRPISATRSSRRKTSPRRCSISSLSPPGAKSMTS